MHSLPKSVSPVCSAPSAALILPMQSAPVASPSIDPVLRLPDVMRLCGLRRTSIYRRMQAGSFPKSIRLGANSIGWRASDIQAWLASREEA